MGSEVPIKLSLKGGGKYRPLFEYILVNLILKWVMDTHTPPAFFMPPTLNSFLKFLKYDLWLTRYDQLLPQTHSTTPEDILWIMSKTAAGREHRKWKFWSKTSKVQPNWCSSGENTIKTRNTISSPVPQAIIPETSLARWNDSFRPENRFHSYLSTIPPQSQSSSFFPLLQFPATRLGNQTPIPSALYGSRRGFFSFF